MGRLIILLLAGDLLWGVGSNIYDVVIPTTILLPEDGLAIVPEMAFGWLQLVVNGVMVLILLLSLSKLWVELYRSSGSFLPIDGQFILACLVLVTFILPACNAWLGALTNALEGRMTVSLQSWRYVVVTACQACLLFPLLSVIYQKWKRYCQQKNEKEIVRDES